MKCSPDILSVHSAEVQAPRPRGNQRQVGQAEPALTQEEVPEDQPEVHPDDWSRHPGETRMEDSALVSDFVAHIKL